MRFEEVINRVSFMPAGLIHIQPDGVALQAPIKMAEDREKALPIPSFGSNYPVPTQQGSHPSRQALSMLTCSEDSQPLTTTSPPATQAGVQGKTGLVLKDYRFLRTQRLKFFLKPFETAWPAELWPEGKHGWPALDCILTCASSAEPASLKALAQTAALDVPPKWVHPSEPDVTQTPRASSLSERQGPFAHGTLIGVAGLTGVWDSARLGRPGSPSESSDLSSYGLSPTPGRSTPASDLQSPTTGLQSLFQPRRQEWSWQRLKAALSWLRDVSKSMSGFSWR